MKHYLVTTGLLFGVMAALHVWRAIAEWPRPVTDLGTVLGTIALIAIPAALAWWAVALLRPTRSPRPEVDGGQSPP